MEVTLDIADVHTTSYDTVEYNVVNWDTGNWYDSTNYNWTPNVSGLYLHNFQARFAGAEQWYLTFYDVTGAVTLLNKQRFGASLAGYGAFWSWQWWLEAGNAYDIRMYAGASTINVTSDSRLWVAGPIAT
jgi:hypothetical protein